MPRGKPINTSNKSDSVVPSKSWGLLGLAIACEIVGAIGLRFSHGFTILLPTVLAISAFVCALYLISHVMKQLPVSTAYPIWAGGGTAGVAIIGILLLNENFTVLKGVGIALVLVGVVLVNSVSEKRSGC
jgi:small multidrug resistance pump